MINLATSHKNYSQQILLRMAVLAMLVIMLVIWQRQFILEIYFKNQITVAGWVINGGILILFALGMARMLQLFFRYTREESAVNRFVTNIQRAIEPTQGVSPDSIIAERYATLLELHTRRTMINHNALASALLAFESSFISFPKFVNNILILTGVFGTIVSLSIALLGASDLLGKATELNGLEVVIHGMSTALSTTMTAILAYLFFGYFFLKLTDTLSFLVSRVEHVTATLLMPKFQIQQETVLADFASMINASRTVIQQAHDSQNQLAQSSARLEQVIQVLRDELQHSGTSLDRIKNLLQRGFRLPEE